MKLFAYSAFSSILAASAIGPLLGAGAAAAAASTPQADQVAADAVCAAVRTEPRFDYARLFSDSFAAAVSVAHAEEIFSSLAKSFGPCLNATPSLLTTADGAAISISLRTGADGRIDGLFVTSVDDPRLAARDWPGFAAALDRLPGQASAYISPDFNIHPEAPLAVGSAFKLWVLGTLWGRVQENDPAWSWPSLREVRDEWKSFPSGDLHLAPAGTKLSIQDFARKMIAESDNTATDHLIHLLGREAVAATAVAMGRTTSATLPASDPLLVTAEFFKLKWAVTNNQADAYVAASPSGRRAILAQLEAVPRSDVCLSAACLAQPNHIESIEFLASTRETCAAMTWLAAKADPTIDGLLAANVPFLTTGGSSHWAWAGFKGGSEPGVLHYAFALRSNTGRSGCFSFAWNDPTTAADGYSDIGTRLAIQALVRTGLALAEAAIDR